MQRSDFILAMGHIRCCKVACLDFSHPYQKAFLRRGLWKDRINDEEVDPVLDQANMYSVGLVAMVMGEMADVADTVETRVN